MYCDSCEKKLSASGSNCFWSSIYSAYNDQIFYKCYTSWACICFRFVNFIFKTLNQSKTKISIQLRFRRAFESDILIAFHVAFSSILSNLPRLSDILSRADLKSLSAEANHFYTSPLVGPVVYLSICNYLNISPTVSIQTSITRQFIQITILTDPTKHSLAV